MVWPLVRSGRPQGLSATDFRLALVYFGLIGAGFMLVQIPFLQRFSVYLGHPTWTLAVILFGMILFTGVGSALSDRIPTTAAMAAGGAAGRRAVLVADTALDPAARRRHLHVEPCGRTAVVLAMLAPLSILLGLAFPIGMRLVGAASDLATGLALGRQRGVRRAGVGGRRRGLDVVRHSSQSVAGCRHLPGGGGDAARDAASARRYNAVMAARVCCCFLNLLPFSRRVSA